MSDSVLVVWSDELLRYDLGATHPMAPGRLEFTLALARDLEVLAQSQVRFAAPEPAGDDLLHLVHDPAYVAAFTSASNTSVLRWSRTVNRNAGAISPGGRMPAAT
jgi:acetoin utilization protein AcuC